MATVRISVRADREVKKATRWWRRNRPANADLFETEFRSAIAAIARDPTTRPVVFERARVPIRRISLPKTGYHLFFTFDATKSEILVVALWSARRGRGPFRR